MPEFNSNNWVNYPGQKSPDFSQISERPSKGRAALIAWQFFKVLFILIILGIVSSLILLAIYFSNFKKAADLSFAAKDKMQEALHLVINRDFKGAADLSGEANADFVSAQAWLDKVKIVRQIPYIGIQLKAVDNVLTAGINLSDGGRQVLLLIDDIVKPLANESITYATITSAQKKEILAKIVNSEELLNQVKIQIDDAADAIDAIPQDKLVKPLRDGILPLTENLPQARELIDKALPMLKVLPEIAGFEEPKSYLFLLQNNSELRPTGGFIGTYGIVKLQDGEIQEFQTDNVYNLDRSTQTILKEPTPWPIAKYLEQKNWSLRDINWAPDFPTTAQKAIEMYDKENQTIINLKNSGQPIIGEKGVEITNIIPYEQNLYGVIAITSEILGGLLKQTGPIVAGNMVFTEDNYQDQLELMVGKLYQEMDIPIAERKGVIKELADQIEAKLMALPLSQMPALLQIGFDALAQKQILMYSTDAELEQLIRDRGWGGELKQTDGDYLMVVDSNMASLKTDQFVRRSINYSLKWNYNEAIAKVEITYQNNADFSWKSSRLRTYTRVYAPLGSELISSRGAMEDDKIKNPQGQVGQVESATEFNKTYFGAFISIEPHEKGVLSFEYKLPQYVADQIKNKNYSLLIQKQPGVIPDLTLALDFSKTIRSATPPEAKSEWFNTAYNNNLELAKDTEFTVIFK